ncbi:hypothetical protein [Halorarius litoreus]|uniref:hypothetical protein n=1 Tax=Halorarius litoreus TaxID=2962676 RepID=UPI0020CFA89D|nr:hypothetical protein [Halorarius litoreus]
MAAEFARQFDPRTSLTPAVLAFLVGLAGHAVDQSLFVRAGPMPAVLTAAVVATVCYLHRRDTPRLQALALLVWGVVASGAGVLGVYLLTVGDQLPRALTETEIVLYDFGLFLWFVLTLAVAYWVAAGRERRTAAVALLLAPVLQAVYGLLLVALVAIGLFA